MAHLILLQMQYIEKSDKQLCDIHSLNVNIHFTALSCHRENTRMQSYCLRAQQWLQLGTMRFRDHLSAADSSKFIDLPETAQEYAFSASYFHSSTFSSLIQS